MIEAKTQAAGAAIRMLDPQLAARIAAGEVIERPASVVKELLENALDAGATSVRVELENGGLDHIRVTDNGAGIAAAELELAFERHATSKLRVLDDLESIITLGFRGEALPSIAAVSHVTIRTRRAHDHAGTALRLQAGIVVERHSIGLPVGTTVDVDQVFENLPVRRKFLRGKQAESSAAQSVAMHYALANPDVAITLLADGQTMFTTASATSLRDVVAALYGLDAADNAIDVDAERHGIRVTGLTSRIGHTKATRAMQSFFVNGRWVRNRILNVALEEGYHSMLMGGRHPVSVLRIAIPPEETDVNVHPAKTEIRFLREREVFGAIRSAVNGAVSCSRSEGSGSLSHASTALDGAMQTPLLEVPEGSNASGEMIGVSSRALPALRVLGQAGALFIIAEGPDGVYMVDQHAAHERVLYDELCEHMARNSVARQSLIEPLVVDLAPTQMGALLDCGALLQDLGFEVEPFGDTSCLIRTVPAMLGNASAAETMQALLEDFASGKEHSERRDRTVATMACKAAVKAGQTLNMEEMRHLVQRLEQTNRPQTCPHGRPTMITLSTSALERQFGRR